MILVWKDIYIYIYTSLYSYTAIYVHCTLVHYDWNNSNSQVYEITDIVGFCPAAGTDWNPSWLDSRLQCLVFTMLLAQLLQLILERVIAIFTIPRVTHQGPSVPLNGEVLLQPRSLVLQTIQGHDFHPFPICILMAKLKGFIEVGPIQSYPQWQVSWVKSPFGGGRDVTNWKQCN